MDSRTDEEDEESSVDTPRTASQLKYPTFLDLLKDNQFVEDYRLAPRVSLGQRLWNRLKALVVAELDPVSTWAPIRFAVEGAADLVQGNELIFQGDRFVPDVQDKYHRQEREAFHRRFANQTYGDYELHCFWWGLFDMARRLFLTSIIIFIHEGTALQIGIGLAANTLAMVLHTHYKAYREDSTDWFQLLSLAAISLTLFIGLLAKGALSDGANSQYDDSARSSVLMAVNILVFVFGITIVVFKLVVVSDRVRRTWRKKRAKKSQVRPEPSPSDEPSGSSPMSNRTVVLASRDAERPRPFTVEASLARPESAGPPVLQQQQQQPPPQSRQPTPVQQRPPASPVSARYSGDVAPLLSNSAETRAGASIETQQIE